jgi:hypothetical protein
MDATEGRWIRRRIACSVAKPFAQSGSMEAGVAARSARTFVEGPRTGMTLVGAVSLIAVVAVLVFVSLPRLRGFAVSENEADARDTARLLARELSVDAGRSVAIGQLAGPDRISRALTDAELLAEGTLLRRHGYLFAVVPLGVSTASPPRRGVVQAAGGAVPARAVLAWPWRCGRTGSSSLLATPDGRVFRHPNSSALWNGPRTTPARLTSWEGWRELP